MKISSGFDPNSQQLNSLASDITYPNLPDATTSYYSSTDGTGVYTRTLTLQPYPTVTGLSKFLRALHGWRYRHGHRSRLLERLPDGRFA